MQTFEREVAGAFKRCNLPERRANFAVDNVSVACLRTASITSKTSPKALTIFLA